MFHLPALSGMRALLHVGVELIIASFRLIPFVMESPEHDLKLAGQVTWNQHIKLSWGKQKKEKKEKKKFHWTHESGPAWLYVEDKRGENLDLFTLNHSGFSEADLQHNILLVKCKEINQLKLLEDFY